jgi:hypothetical protein
MTEAFTPKMGCNKSRGVETGSRELEEGVDVATR